MNCARHLHVGEYPHTPPPRAIIWAWSKHPAGSGNRWFLSLFWQNCSKCTSFTLNLDPFCLKIVKKSPFLHPIFDSQLCTFWDPVLRPVHLFGYTGVSGKEDAIPGNRVFGPEKRSKTGISAILDGVLPWFLTVFTDFDRFYRF